jgi:hypothetical protein
MTMRYPALAMLAISLFPMTAFAQGQAPAADPPGNEKINQVIVYGDDPCPRGNGEEIVVCARKGEGERFRIPEPLRGDPNAPKNAAWGVRAQQLEYAGRSGIGSCSPNGPGGMTGCFNQLVRQARAERAQGDGTNWVRLVEEAREDRMGRVDADSDEIEARVKAEEAARAAKAAEAAKPDSPE